MLPDALYNTITPPDSSLIHSASRISPGDYLPSPWLSSLLSHTWKGASLGKDKEVSIGVIVTGTGYYVFCLVLSIV